MPDEENPYPNWAKNATKGDLLRAIVFLRSEVTALAGVVTAIRTQNDKEARERMDAYFAAAKTSDEVISDIGGILS